MDSVPRAPPARMSLVLFTRRRFVTLASVLLVWNPLVIVVITFIDGDDLATAFWPSLLIGTVPATIGVLFGPLAAEVERRVYARRGLPAPKRGVGWHILVATATMPVGTWLGFRLAHLVYGGYELDWGEHLRAIAIGTLVMAVFAGWYNMGELRRARAESDLALAKLEAERLRASLDALTAQMNPHFLFNALNTVASLVHKDADRAEDIVLELADVYRAVIEATKKHRATLADELALCRSYCAIEEARFGDALETHVVVEDGIDPAAIPFAPLVVQPLVENAIKHGLRDRSSKRGRVEIAVQREGDHISVHVRDDGTGMLSFGDGLQLLRNSPPQRHRHRARQCPCSTRASLRRARHARAAFRARRRHHRDRARPARDHPMTLRVLIVDDEPLARERLERLLAAHQDVVVVGHAGDGAEALVKIGELAPDLVLLDIDMPVLSGLDAARALGDRAPKIVFATAYEEHAIRAFEAAAFDYLVKPVRAERLAATLERARKASGSADLGKLTRMLGRDSTRVALKSGTTYAIVDAARIARIEALDHYAQVVVEGGPEVLCDDTLDALEARLGERFLRVHRATILNADKIERLEREGDRRYAAILTDGTRASISRERLPAVKKALGLVE